jgi:pyruvate kinase
MAIAPNPQNNPKNPAAASSVAAKRTKIVATVGPASDSPAVLLAMINAGVDMFRLNLSHGEVSEHLTRLQRIREASVKANRIVAILADLPGPKIRSGGFGNEGVDLTVGMRINLKPGDLPSSNETLYVDYDSLLADIAIDDRLVLGDGEITMRVLSKNDTFATAEILTAGRARGRPGVHIPSERSRLQAPTDEDLVLLRAMSEAGVDYAAISFVRSAADMQRARDVSGPNGPSLIAKIETQSAVDDLAAILEVTDAVMVARGDLGIECPLETVPHLQKMIIRSCVDAGVPVITATQMLESMIHAPQPTRAEVSDVANAVFDGTDAVMLSGETAIGDHPIEVIATMARIVKRAEQDAQYRSWATRLGRVQRRRDTVGELRVTQAVTLAGWQAADEIGAAVIVCCTRSGRTARAMARLRPLARLVGASPDAAVIRRLALSWGVEPLLLGVHPSTDELVWHAVESVVHQGIATKDDYVLVLAGDPKSTGGATDVLRVVRVR